jgi:hypothetical protein
MSDNRVLQTTQYTVKPNGLSLATKLGVIDLTGMFEELNIFDSVFNPCMTGTILIRDAKGLSNKLSFDGSEILLIDMGKTENEATIKKSFRVYKQSSRKTVNMSTELYVLHFVSDEFILSQQIKISKSYRDTYTNVALDILKNYLLVNSDGLFLMEESKGIRTVVLPNKTPFECLDWCSKKAVNDKLSPTFLFFENKFGYNFLTISSMLQQKAIHDINYQPKNLALKDLEENEMMGARYLEVVSQFDLNKNIKHGVYAGTFIGFDITTRNVVKKIVDFDSVYSTGNHANKTPNIGVITNKAGIKNTEMFNSRRVLFSSGIFNSASNYIKENDPTSIDSDDDTYNYVIQRESAIRNLMNQRLKVVMPGNFDLISGTNVNVTVPTISEQSSEKNQDNMDKTKSGKYLIVATRQMITYDKHETIMEIATDSTNKDTVYQSTQIQNDLADFYG